MASNAASGEPREVLDRADAALDALVAEGVSPVDGRDALVLVERVERLARKVAALQVGLLQEIDRRGLHRHDGHASAKVLVRHAARLSDAEGTRRSQAARALRDLPEVAAALAAGELGMDQVGVIARAHANERVQDQLCRLDGTLARLAASLSFPMFRAAVLDWERLADADGTADTATRNHAKRDVRLVQDPDGSWRLHATCGSRRGAVHRSILAAFLRIEADADWAKARAEHGDDATVEHLARTDAQRRADAFDEIFRSAADAHAAASGGSKIVTNLVIDLATFERELRRLAGATPAPLDLDPLVTSDPDPDLDIDPDPLATSDPGPTPIPDPDLTADPDPDPDEAAVGAGAGPGLARSGFGREGSGAAAAPPGAGGTAPAAHPERSTDAAPGPDHGPAVPAEGQAVPSEGQAVRFRSSTLDGEPVAPSEIVAEALVGHVRRAVVGAGSVVIDLGREQRLYTGLAALAVRLSLSHCSWPGCLVPTTQCQLDHLQPWSHGGRTCPGNGAPHCGKHNRHKERGYRVVRDLDGATHTYRPDGTEIL